MTPIEAPSGKNENTENFPVTKLVGAKYKPHVAAYYIFARAADDISDDPLIAAEDKCERLDKFDAALMNPNDNSVASVIPLRDSLKETGVTPQHARDLLIAFKRDTEKLRYNNWEELLDYCNYSASPVGRYLLDLHGESKTAYPANDALCSVLQIINHLQDCADDYRTLDRVYIPLDTMKECGTDPMALSAEESSPALRKAMDIMLDKMIPMMALADTFPAQVKNRRLRIDTAVICEVARMLLKILRERDPLCERCKLTKLQKVQALLIGTIKGFW